MKKLVKNIIRKAIRYAFTPFVIQDYIKFKKLADDRFELNPIDMYPCIFDNTKETKFDTHYVYHPAWAARKVRESGVSSHTDISSTLHFSSMLSAFMPVNFYDYRPAKLNLSGLKSMPGDLNNLPFLENSIESLSCMHTIEHIGLGRYGDKMDAKGDEKAISELKRVLKPGGRLIFVVPVGKPKIEFNAHRIYSYDMIMNYFADMECLEFSLIPDDALSRGMIYNATREESDKQKYGCGCFVFRKK